MRLVAVLAGLACIVDRLECQYLTGMTAQAIFIGRLDPGVRFVAFVTVQPSHRDPVREICSRRFSMAGQAPVAVRDEGLQPFWGEGMAPETGDVLHSHPVYLPVLMTAKTCILDRPERMYRVTVAIFADEFLHKDMPRVTR